MSMELITTLLLTTFGIDLPCKQVDQQSSPYLQESDTDRAWNREVCLRILKINDMRRACMYLSSFEEKFAIWIGSNFPREDWFTLKKIAEHGSLSENKILNVDILNYLTYVFDTDRMPNKMITTSSVQIKQLIELQQKCCIEEIWIPESKRHRHVFIAISGFLSQTANNDEDWIHLKNFCRVRGMPFYALRWESQDPESLEKITRANADKNNLADIISTTNKFSDLFSASKLKKMASFAQDQYTEGVNVFKGARYNAKTTGKMLAHFLISSRNDIFGDQTFSLMGFSLGS